MASLREILITSDVIKAAFEVSKETNQEVFLVGGTVRDILMKSMLGNDFDFVVEGKGIAFAKAFAYKVNGSFFVLDEERDTARVVSKKGFQADFSGVRGSIDEDLRSRDFSINSMAIPLDSIFESQVSIILDPLDGKNDIGSRLLKASSQNSIQEDPLRIMRAFRFSSSLDFVIDEGLSSQIKRHCEDLNRVSEERVRAELFMILEMPPAYKTLKGMDEAGVLKSLFPEVEKWKGFYQGGWHIHDLFDHSMKTVGTAEEVLSHLNSYFPKHGKEIENYMAEEIEAYVTRKGLLKLASLLHDSGKFYTRVMEDGRGRFLGHEGVGEGITSDISKGLKLGRRSEMILRGLTSNHMRVLALSKLNRDVRSSTPAAPMKILNLSPIPPPPIPGGKGEIFMVNKVTKRAKYRFFRDTDGFNLDLLLLSLADAMATPIEGERFQEFKRLVQGLADYYFDEFITVPPAPLLTGEDIMKLFGIPQGKKVGEMLEILREVEIMGKVSNKREAVAYLKKMFL